MTSTKEGKRSHEEATSPLADLLASNSLHDVMKAHKDIVALEHNASVEDALRELAENQISSAPVELAPSIMDNDSGTYLGILDVASILACLTDDLLQEGEEGKSEDDRLEEIVSHSEVFFKRKLITILGKDVALRYRGEGEQSLADVIREGFLGEGNHVAHRIVVFNARGTIVNVVSMSDILRFLNKNVDKLGSLADRTMADLGCVKSISSVQSDVGTAKLCLKMQKEKLAAVPVVDGNGIFKFSFATSDLKGLTAGKVGLLLQPVSKFVAEMKASHHHDIDTTCDADTTLRAAMHKMMSQKLHRLYVVDSNKKVIGCLSLSDILRAVVDNE
eukprot:m.58835 g.58835  ORF g.58835 m.58835 type:complete len:332 (-) comp11288_c0_seq1:166-1161(-)